MRAINKGNKENNLFCKKVINVHSDDIHGLCAWKEYIISGSKDTTIRLFDQDGIFISQLSKPPKSSYERWVTALDVFEDGTFLAGFRNGYMLHKDIISGKNSFSGFPSNVLITDEKHCKTRNDYRIAGIKSLKIDNKHVALVGLRGEFYQYDLDKKRMMQTYSFENQDWVYGFAEIDEYRFAAINGASLFLFKNEDNTWKMESFLKESKTQSKQRPFVASVQPMQKVSVTSLAMAIFGGKTKVMDIETKETVHETKEHKGRVWQAMPYSEQGYASCADDKTIKIWDVRESKSVVTLRNHPSRVSALTFFNDKKFVAATCPEDPYHDDEKEQFYFYDLRKL